jgi:hypothetical protein
MVTVKLDIEGALLAKQLAVDELERKHCNLSRHASLIRPYYKRKFP